MDARDKYLEEFKMTPTAKLLAILNADARRAVDPDDHRVRQSAASEVLRERNTRCRGL